MRVAEIYVSTQGEGPRVGEPTVFLRFGGCNLRCPGWPCDTQYAIDPRFRHEWLQQTPDAIAESIYQVTHGFDSFNVCFTGGEPFLQKNKDLQELTTLLYKHPRLKTIECFSNGTLQYPEWATQAISFIMDWKLPGSGEDPFNANRLLNLSMLNQKDSVKFVIKDRNDFDLAVSLWQQYVQATPVQTFYGAVWGEIENQELVQWALDEGLPWRLNVQVHNYVWDRNERAR